jgi:hypothetical protein
MEIKIFGKSLFKFSKNEALFVGINSSMKESKYLPDFYGRSFGGGSMSIENVISSSFATELAGTGAVTKYAETKKEEPAKEKEKITPKGVYNLQMLNDKSFKLKTEPTYLDNLIQSFKDKLSLIKSEEYDMRNGTQEIASILMRLENRKNYSDHKKVFEEFPYTTTNKINELVKEHDHLKMGQVAEFMADMPKEAIDVMKKYNKEVDLLCKKQAVFYIIANKEDFKKTEKRRDPILLAQSPFGHFWQILGAWDEEMMLIEEL